MTANPCERNQLVQPEPINPQPTTATWSIVFLICYSRRNVTERGGRAQNHSGAKPAAAQKLTFAPALTPKSSSSPSRLLRSSLRSRARSAFSVSDCELSETYSPAAIDMAPATSTATPAIRTSFCFAAAAATPTIRLAVDMIPSLAPRTAALSHPMRSTRWVSL